MFKEPPKVSDLLPLWNWIWEKKLFKIYIRNYQRSKNVFLLPFFYWILILLNFLIYLSELSQEHSNWPELDVCHLKTVGVSFRICLSGGAIYLFYRTCRHVAVSLHDFVPVCTRNKYNHEMLASSYLLYCKPFSVCLCQMWIVDVEKWSS